MRKNWYWLGREWPYKNVKPKIIVEQYFSDDSNEELKDYKFHCFNGKPFILQVDYNRFVEHYRNIYDLDFNLINATIKYPPNTDIVVKKPNRLKEMINIAEVLSRDFKYIRVDLYESNNKVFFGELTFHHGSGFEKVTPDSFENALSSQLVIATGK